MLSAANSFLSSLIRYARDDKTVPIFIVPIDTVLSVFLMTVVTVMTFVTLELHTIYLRKQVSTCHRCHFQKQKEPGSYAQSLPLIL